MRKIFIFPVLILSVLLCGCRQESTDLKKLKSLLSEQYNPVIERTQNGKITSFNTIDKNMQNAVDIILTSTADDMTPWLKKHIGNYSAAFLFAFAHRLARNKEPLRDYWFWRTAAIYRGASDASLCKDQYVGQYLTVLIMNFIAPADAMYNLEESRAFVKNKKENISLLEDLMAWDIKHPAKNSPAWFCASGHAVNTSDAIAPEKWVSKRQEFSKDFFEKTLESYSEEAGIKRIIRRAVSDLDLVCLAKGVYSVKNKKDIFLSDYDVINFSAEYNKTNNDGTRITGKEWILDEYKIILEDKNVSGWLATEEITKQGARAFISKSSDGKICCKNIDEGVCSVADIKDECDIADIPYIYNKGREK